MPDPTKQTISATQMPALLNVSPYFSRWMLYHHFIGSAELGAYEDERIREGKRLQPFVLSRATDELRLLIVPNEAYIRRGLLGATRDALITCPDRGPGALETKCVFDYRVWMSEWSGGERVPPHIELQLQQQMFVGDGEKPFDWGVITVWVCASQRYFERRPIPALWERFEREGAAFFADIAARREPDPFGLTIEMDWLEQLYPTVPHKTLDLREVPGAARYAEKTAVYQQTKLDAGVNEKVAEALRAEFMALAKDAETVLLPGNAIIRIKTQKRGRRLSVVPPNSDPEEFIEGDNDVD